MKIDQSLSTMNKSFAPQATVQVKRYTRNFSEALLANATLIAGRRRSQDVEMQHVDEAFDNLALNNKKIWSKDLPITLGGAFFGAFVQGFITEINYGNTTLITVYVILGLVGMFLLLWGLFH